MENPPNRTKEESVELLAAIRAADDRCTRGEITFQERTALLQTLVPGIGDLIGNSFGPKTQRHPKVHKCHLNA